MSTPKTPLTPRQREVLALTAAGHCHWRKATWDPAPILINARVNRVIHANTVRSLVARGLLTPPGLLTPKARQTAQLTASGRPTHTEAATNVN